MFEPLSRDGLAKTAFFYTPHGKISTPNILPVINPNIGTITVSEMKRLGMEGLITNSYIIRRTDKLREKAELSGLHRLIGFDGPIMTDSGTFQSHVYSEIEYDNISTFEFQKKIGSDISTIVDIFTEPNFSWKQAKEAVLETKRRLDEITDAGKTIVAGPIQGSVYPDLRRMSAELMSTGISGYLPVGGVVPLLENYRYDALVDVIINSRLYADPGKPLHLFGGGHPMFMGMSVLLGIDMFDSASYVKYARDDRVLMSDGSRDLSKISLLPWWSPLYGKFTVKELSDLPKEERIHELSIHNLGAIFNELNEIRERIHEQTLWQYVEGRSRSHPALYRAFRRILEYGDVLEPYEDLSKKSPFFFFDELSRNHPAIIRLRKFSDMAVRNLENQMKFLDQGDWHPGRQHSPEFLQSYSISDNAYFHRWHDIPVPVELEETFPIEQLVTTGVFEGQSAGESEENDDASDPVDRSTGGRDLYLEKARMIFRYQFGVEDPSDMFPDQCQVTHSRKTGRIRGVFLDGTLLGTVRAHDGFFTLSINGAERMMNITDRHRISVTEESAEFNRKGLNVFFKFITSADHGIIPGNEVLVTDPSGELIAVGRANVPGREMRSYSRGVAVRVRAGKDAS